MTAKEREKQWLAVAAAIVKSKGKLDAALFVKVQKLVIEEEESQNEDYSPFD